MLVQPGNHHRPKGRILLFWGGSKIQEVSVFGLREQQTVRWRGTCLGIAIDAVWPLTESQHINLLELQAMFLLLQQFITVMAHINRQGGVTSAALLRMVEDLWRRASEHLLSLKALHIPGLENRGADPMSRGSTPPDEWRPQIRIRFGRWGFCQQAQATVPYGSPWLCKMNHLCRWRHLHTCPSGLFLSCWRECAEVLLHDSRHPWI